MATIRCPHCASNGPFEIQEITTPKLKPITLVYCEACGAIIGGFPGKPVVKRRSPTERKNEVVENEEPSPREERLLAVLNTEDVHVARNAARIILDEFDRATVSKIIEENLTEVVPVVGPEIKRKPRDILSLAADLAGREKGIRNMETGGKELTEAELIKFWKVLKKIGYNG